MDIKSIKKFKRLNTIYRLTHQTTELSTRKSPGNIKYRKDRRVTYSKQRLELFDLLGGKFCIRCGFSDIRALQFDHINGGGSKESRLITTENRYKIYLNDPNIKEKIQVLCANCNWIKRYENKENR